MGFEYIGENILIEHLGTICKQPKELEDYNKKERELFLEDIKKDNNYYNGINNRLVRVRDGEDGIKTLEVENNYYEDNIKTNLYYSSLEEKKDIDFFNKYKNDLAKQLGSNGVIKTLEGSYAFTIRSETIIGCKSNITTTFSGSVMGLRNGSIKDNLDVLVLKELEEELGITKDFIISIELLGIYENKELLNKYELLFLVDTIVTRKNLIEKYYYNKDKREISDLFYVEGLNELFDKGKTHKLGENVKTFIDILTKKGYDNK